MKNYPAINSILFQGSEANTSKTIENIFIEAENKIGINQVLIFDNLDLSDKSQNNCLKVLHTKLEMSLDPEEKSKISFIGMSNCILDEAKMNRTIFLASPNILLDDICLIIEAIAKSFDDKLFKKYERKYRSLGNIFFFYKEKLKSLKDEFIMNFHGNRDLYYIIKIFSSIMLKYNKPDDPNIIDKAFKKSLARNLNGLEINGESRLKQNIKDINFDDLSIMDLIKDNFISKDNRFLLLISEKSMFNFLMDIIGKEIEQMNNNYVTYIGSPFKGDKINTSYQAEMILNLERNVAEGKIIILIDLDQIYSIFYDLFNQNYINKDGKKFYHIYYGSNIQKLSLVNENTKIIILVDKNNLRKQKLEFLNRFEKYNITYDNI